MNLSKELGQDVIQFVKKSQDVCYLAKGLTQEFEDVIESGFGRHKIKKLLEMIENVSIAETEADNLEDALVRRLYEVEEKMNSVESPEIKKSNLIRTIVSTKSSSNTSIINLYI